MKELQHTNWHPLLNIREQVEREGLVVLDGITDMPIQGEAYISPFAVTALCERGTLHTEYDMNPVTFQTHDFCILKGDHMLKANEWSADYCARLIVMSDEFVSEFKQLNVTHFNAHVGYYFSHPSLHLSDEQYRQMTEAFNLLKTVSTLGGLCRKNMILNVFHTIIMMRFEFSPIPEETSISPKFLLSERFKDAIVDHFRESREVSFYSNMFALSPKYFSTLIKQETGITAGEWIDCYVTLQAKSMLLRRHDLTIQQVADLLGFSEQASFSRFFKKRTGQSPSEFRQM